MASCVPQNRIKGSLLCPVPPGPLTCSSSSFQYILKTLNFQSRADSNLVSVSTGVKSWAPLIGRCTEENHKMKIAVYIWQVRDKWYWLHWFYYGTRKRKTSKIYSGADEFISTPARLCFSILRLATMSAMPNSAVSAYTSLYQYYWAEFGWVVYSLLLKYFPPMPSRTAHSPGLLPTSLAIPSQSWQLAFLPLTDLQTSTTFPTTNTSHLLQSANLH